MSYGKDSLACLGAIEPFEWVAICPLCGIYPGCCDTEMQARLAWNTRTPILSAEEMEMLYENRPD